MVWEWYSHFTRFKFTYFGTAHDAAGAERLMNSAASGTGTFLGEVKRKSIRGGVVTVLSQGISTLIHLASTVVLARLLSPEDFGVTAMVAAITAFASLFQDLGLSTAAVQKGQLSRELQSNLFWANVGLGFLLTGTLAAAAPLVARFYARPELTWVTVALSFNFLIRSLGTQHGVLLTRRMQFARQAVTSIGGSLVGLGISIYLGMTGYRYWALVWGGLSSAASSVLLLWIVSPFRPTWPSRGAGVRSLVRFGANVTAFNIINYFHRNLDNLLIGKVWGAEALGLYTRAYALLMFPIQAIRNPLNAVAFPAMSKLQNQPDLLRLYYLRATSLIAFFSMPLAAYSFVASDAILNVFLGPRWTRAGSIFSCLALAAFVQPTSGFAGNLLLSTGQGGRYLQCGIFNTSVLSACFLVGLAWGPLGVALAYSIGNYVVLYAWLRWAFIGTTVTFADFAKACAAPATSSLIAALLVMLIKPLVRTQLSALQLASYAAVFALVLIAAVLSTKTGKMTARVLLELAGRPGQILSHRLETCRTTFERLVRFRT